jgi:hypothetical protein
VRIPFSLSRFGSLQIQLQQLRQYLLVAHPRVPAVGGEDSGVKLLVSEVEPGGPGIVEVRQPPLGEFLGAFLVFRDRPRVADRADATVIGIVDLARPRPGLRAVTKELAQDFVDHRRVRSAGA